MLTFEKVLAAFKDYLEEDDRYTILMTPRGYTIMEWDASQQNWAGAEICACYLEYKVTLCNRPLEDTERQMIQRQVAEMESSFQ